MFGRRSKEKKIVPQSQVQLQNQQPNKYDGPGKYSGSPTKHYCKLCGKEIKTQDSARDPNSCDTCYHWFLDNRSCVPPEIVKAEVDNQYRANFECFAEYQVYIDLWRTGVITQEQFDKKVAEYIEGLRQRQAKFDEIQWDNQIAEAEERATAQQRLLNMHGL